MLLPDNINPKLTTYYIGALVLNELQKKGQRPILKLYEELKVEHEVAFSALLFSLDWLYLIDVAVVTDEGIVKLCS